jgi:hypothetical protein
MLTVTALTFHLALHAAPVAARLDIGDRLPAQRDDPSTSTSGGNSSGGGTSGGASTNASCGFEPGQCFGAVGMACQGALPTEAEVALGAAAGVISPAGVLFAAASFLETSYLGCAPDGSCVVNAGSWAHDECCASEGAAGVFCSVEGTLQPGGPCQGSWDRAVHRVIHGLNWRRHLDQCRVDGDGRVDFADYCAPAGTIVARSDRTRCCGQRTRPFRFESDFPQAVRQALILDGSFTPRVCTGQAPASAPSGNGSGGGSSGGSSTSSVNGRSCTTNAQCGSGAICAAPHAGAAKVCLLI